MTFAAIQQRTVDRLRAFDSASLALEIERRLRLTAAEAAKIAAMYATEPFLAEHESLIESAPCDESPASPVAQGMARRRHGELLVLRAAKVDRAPGRAGADVRQVRAGQGGAPQA